MIYLHIFKFFCSLFPQRFSSKHFWTFRSFLSFDLYRPVRNNLFFFHFTLVIAIGAVVVMLLLLPLNFKWYFIGLLTNDLISEIFQMKWNLKCDKSSFCSKIIERERKKVADGLCKFLFFNMRKWMAASPFCAVCATIEWTNECGRWWCEHCMHGGCTYIRFCSYAHQRVSVLPDRARLMLCTAVMPLRATQRNARHLLYAFHLNNRHIRKQLVVTIIIWKWLWFVCDECRWHVWIIPIRSVAIFGEWTAGAHCTRHTTNRFFGRGRGSTSTAL